VSELREIVEEDSFRESVEELGVSAKRMDAVLEGVIWTIARRPEYYPRVRGTASLRRALVPAALHVPRLRIWFDHDDETARLLLAELDPGEET
jgi:hypothetical protein